MSKGLSLPLTSEALQRHLRAILKHMPKEWRGTTYKNSNLLQRSGFATNLAHLLSNKGDGDVTTEDLRSIGTAEDYFRVSSNISTTLEFALGLAKGYDVTRVFTFASTSMPMIAVALTSSGAPVHVYMLGETLSPFTDAQTQLLRRIGANITFYEGAPPKPTGDAVVLTFDETMSVNADGVLGENVLYIVRPERIDPNRILIIRKRMSTPVTTPMAEAWLQKLAGVEITANREVADPQDVAAFYSHLQTLCGTAVNTASNPVCSTAGLPSLCSLWITLVQRGGADILMCSTAYGGSMQLLDVLCTTSPSLRKHTFDIQGLLSIEDSIQNLLESLDVASLQPTTVLFVEIPTNPDMKVPDLAAVAEMLRSYMQRSGKQVLLLVDTTFAPNSQVMKKMQDLLPGLNVMVFLSMSKSVSRGLTTAGAIIGNHTVASAELLDDVRSTVALMGTAAKPDQMVFLVGAHVGVEKRCEEAYAVAAEMGKCLQAAVYEHCNEHAMRLAFVTPEQAELGFTTSTFSFNLPCRPGASQEQNSALAQRFVDLLCDHPTHFKPCVSFGQDNALVYATVPATSTQGAISEEHKQKQAVAGVQLTRLSFPPSCDIDAVKRILSDSIKTLYSEGVDNSLSTTPSAKFRKLTHFTDAK